MRQRMFRSKETRTLNFSSGNDYASLLNIDIYVFTTICLVALYRVKIIVPPVKYIQ